MRFFRDNDRAIGRGLFVQYLLVNIGERNQRHWRDTSENGGEKRTPDHRVPARTRNRKPVVPITIVRWLYQNKHSPTAKSGMAAHTSGSDTPWLKGHLSHSTSRGGARTDQVTQTVHTADAKYAGTCSARFTAGYDLSAGRIPADTK